MIPIAVPICGYCGYCGYSPEALMREKKVSWSKFYFMGVLGLKQNPQTPQYPPPANLGAVPN